jgi:hypothetical protein
MSCGHRPRKPSVAYYCGAFYFATNVVFYLSMVQKTRRKLATVQEDAGLKPLREAYSSSSRMVSAASQAFSVFEESI